MAKLAISTVLKSANRYHASRPCSLLLADGTQAGITAPKNAAAGSTLLALFAPDGSLDVPNWKTAPVTGGARQTQYSCCQQNTAIGSIAGWHVIETPRKILIGLETAGPIQNGHTIQAGEVLIALDSALGESATYGNADGLTMYGLLVGACNKGDTTTGLGGSSNGQSRAFVGADTTSRRLEFVDTNAIDFAPVSMNPAPFGTGRFLVRELGTRASGSFRLGDPAWAAACSENPHWTAITINGATFRVLGTSATVSYWTETPYRKNGASADTVYHRRAVATYATWGDLLQAIWDDLGANGVYWQQDASA